MEEEIVYTYALKNLLVPVRMVMKTSSCVSISLRRLVRGRTLFFVTAPSFWGRLMVRIAVLPGYSTVIYDSHASGGSVRRTFRASFFQSLLMLFFDLSCRRSNHFWSNMSRNQRLAISPATNLFLWLHN